MSIKVNDRYIDCYWRILRIPMDWLYVNSSRIEESKKIFSHVIRKNMERVSFIIKEKRYGIINDKVLEAMYTIIIH